MSVERGDFFQDYYGHPVLCTGYDEKGPIGISLIDGSPRASKNRISSPRVLSLDEALAIRESGEEWSACPQCDHPQGWHEPQGCGFWDGCQCQTPRDEARSHKVPDRESFERGLPRLVPGQG